MVFGVCVLYAFSKSFRLQVNKKRGKGVRYHCPREEWRLPVFRWRHGDRLRRRSEAVVHCYCRLILLCDPLAGRFKCVLSFAGNHYYVSPGVVYLPGRLFLLVVQLFFLAFWHVRDRLLRVFCV